MADKLTVPSGLEITTTGLFRKIAYLTSEDLEFIFTSRSKRAKVFRPLIGELLGKAFAGSYSRRRSNILGKDRIDFWKLRNGAFRKAFIEGAIQAKLHGVDIDYLIYRAEDFAKSKKIGYPSPGLVCGDFVFSEVLNGWKPGFVDDPTPPDTVEYIEKISVDEEANWIWQPGAKWSGDKFISESEDDQ